MFLLPVALAILIWLPARVRFARRNTGLRRISERPEQVELLALRALATGSKARAPALPDLPTTAEAGSASPR